MILSYAFTLYSLLSIISTISTFHQGTSDTSLTLNDERYSSSFNKDILFSSSQFISELMPTIISSLTSSSSSLSFLLPPIILANADVTLKRYSYICLDYNLNLCLGLSPGNLPDDQPYEGLFLQVKPRVRNEEKALDYRKMRWDIVNDQGRIYLSNFTDLCLARNDGINTVNIYNCDNNPKNMNNWYVEEIPDSPGRHVIRMNNTNTCVSVHNCNKNPDGSCSSDLGAGVALGTPASPFLAGAYVLLNQCYDYTVKGVSYPQYERAQVFRVELDCAAGCSPDMLNNKVCEEPCNTVECSFDHGYCVNKPTPQLTYSPTPDTQQPTATPVLETTGFGALGILFLVLIILAIIGCCVFCLVCRKRRKNKEEAETIEFNEINTDNYLPPPETKPSIDGEKGDLSPI